MKKKSLFELNEKVLRSSFKIKCYVRTARVFELKKKLPYIKHCIAQRSIKDTVCHMKMFGHLQ